MGSGQCRDCGEKAAVESREWGRSAKPRCPKCGGLLDRVGHRVPTRRTPGGKRVRSGAASRQPDVNRRESL